MILLFLSIVLVAVAITLLVQLIAAGMYDVGEARIAKLQSAQPNARRWRARPLVTAVVSAQDSARQVEYTLQSLYVNKYRKLEVIVVDHGSQDDTIQLVKAFITAHPKFKVRLVARKQAAGHAKALSTAVRRYGKGELIICLDAGERLLSHSLMHVVQRYNAEPELQTVQLRALVQQFPSLTSLFERYLSLLTLRQRKADQVLSARQVVAGAVVCRREAFRKMIHQRIDSRGRTAPFIMSTEYTAYLHDAAIERPARTSLFGLMQSLVRLQLTRARAAWSTRSSSNITQSSRRRLAIGLRWASLLLRMIVAIAVPSTIVYFVYVAINLREVVFLSLSCGALGLMLLSAIWGDNQLPVRQKLRYTLAAPLSYSLFVLLMLVQLVVVLSLALRPRQLVRA